MKREPPPAPADLSDVESFDNSFRWWVRSRTSRKRYLVDTSLYNHNGKCACPDFLKHFEKYLARGHDAATVFATGVLGPKLRPYQLGVDDALRCWHICRAQKKIVSCFSKAVQDANDAQRK